MKAWDTVSADFDPKCRNYNSTFNQIKDLYIKDHELKFYIASVNCMAKNNTYDAIGLKKDDIV